MEVIIEQEGVEKLKLKVNPTTQLKELKQSIAKSLKVHIDEIILSYKKQKLPNNNTTLSEYGIKESKEILQLIISSKQDNKKTKEEPSIKVNLENLSEEESEEEDGSLCSPKSAADNKEKLFYQKQLNITKAKYKILTSREHKHRLIKRLRKPDEDIYKLDEETVTVDHGNNEDDEDYEQIEQKRIERDKKLEEVKAIANKKPLDLEFILKCIQLIKCNSNYTPGLRPFYTSIIRSATKIQHYPLKNRGNVRPPKSMSDNLFGVKVKIINRVAHVVLSLVIIWDLLVEVSFN